MNKNDKVIKQIRKYFKKTLGIVLEDSPQILNKYLYLEFEDRNGIEQKIRIPYGKQGLIGFLKMSKKERFLFIMEQIIHYECGNWS